MPRPSGHLSRSLRCGVGALYVLSLASIASGCSETSLVYTPKDVPEIDPGGISGRVCDTSGRTWLADAMAYVNLYDESGAIYQTISSYSNEDGRWSLADLPGDRDYHLYVQSGGTIIQEEDFYLGSGEQITLEEPDCFDPQNLNIAIVTGLYDDFDVVLQQLGFTNYTVVDGESSEAANAFFSDADGMAAYDIIFVNGGFTEDGVVYSLTDPTDPVPAQNLLNLQQYVQAGGSLYASDWAYDAIELAWPDRIDWVGADELPNDAQTGNYDVVSAAVSDTSLAEYLGKSYVDIQYDLPVWPPIENTSTAVSVHLTGNISYSDGLDDYTLTSVPMLVSFNDVQGKVVFSTFRVIPNTDDDVLAILQYMLYGL
ncbi:MAG: hypothetical protein EXR69_05105 [Myxococcales bacterium]|nr:hypothetical protein [Myxococcales bacterium]